MKLNINVPAALVVVASALVSQVAGAAAIDVGSVVSEIGAQAIPVAVVGGAVMLIMVAVKAFKWVRAAFS